MIKQEDNRVLPESVLAISSTRNSNVVNSYGTFNTFSCTFNPRSGSRAGECD